LFKKKKLLNDIKPIFFSGMSGSGSSLTFYLVDQFFKSIASIDESNNYLRNETSVKLVKDYKDFQEYLSDHFNNKFRISYNRIRDDILKLYYCNLTKENTSGVVLDKHPITHMTRSTTLKRIFPKSKFVIVYRDPKENIEGLLRKWPLFSQTSLVQMTLFWNNLYENYLNNYHRSESINKSTIFIDYNALVMDVELFLEKISQELKLERRKEVKSLKDRNDKQGKNIRNIRKGKIIISQKGIAKWKEKFTDVEIELIDKQTADIYYELQKLSIFSLRSRVIG